jgi:hypothetical protein
MGRGISPSQRLARQLSACSACLSPSRSAGPEKTAIFTRCRVASMQCALKKMQRDSGVQAGATASSSGPNERASARPYYIRLA